MVTFKKIMACPFLLIGMFLYYISLVFVGFGELFEALADWILE
jgi:hypothetical protein